jgi:hypothetical protein
MAGIEPAAHGNFNRVKFSSLYVIRVSSGIWTPLKSASIRLYSLADLDSSRVFYHCNVSFFEYCTESVLNRHKSHLIYIKNRTKIIKSYIFRFENSV